MTRQASGAIRQPANDTAAFDVSRQSPEDIARLFERWKQQRKRLEPDEPPARPARSASTRFMPVIVRTPAPTEATPAPVEPVAAEPPSEPGAIHYSAPFAAILAASGKGAAAQRAGTFALGPAARRMPHTVGRRSRARLILAGAASVLALAAASATVLWQPSAPQQAGMVQVQLAPTAHSGTARAHQASLPVEIVSAPPEVQTASRLLPLAVQPPHERGDWQLALEIALLQPPPAEAEAALAHLSPKLKPNVAVVQTASKPARKPATTAESAPEPQVVTSTDARPAGDPEAVSVAVPPAPVASAAPDKHPDVFYQRGNDKAFGGGFGTHASASAGKSHGSTGGDPTGGGSGNSGGGATGGGDTGGSGAGGATGGDTGGSTGSGSGSSGSGAGGDTGGSTGGGASGDTGGSSAGSGDGSSGASGGSGADSGNSGGDQSGDSQGGDSSGGSKPDKPKKGADVSGGVSVGGGGISASVGGHVGGIGGGVSAGIGN